MSTPSSWLSQRSSARQQESLAKARQELTELSVTMRSKDRAVDMTVGPQGEPTTWRFLNSGHQAMSGQAPAVGVPEARATGRHEVTLRETTRFEELTGTGLGLTRSGLKDLQLDRPPNRSAARTCRRGCGPRTVQTHHWRCHRTAGPRGHLLTSGRAGRFGTGSAGDPLYGGV
ncbi:YbaB/EbfC family nucleoid-associated protein [Streptomyces sp. NPDC059837]|uniref:YbaB/EbfC family nucleoid-associated protein n=1 Tax=unclassified Streptomyces TaxID=2593676 RepID=UPI00365E7BE5